MRKSTGHRVRRAAVPIIAIGVAFGAVVAGAVTGNDVVIGEDQSPENLNQISLGGATVVTHRSLCPIQCENLLVFRNFKYAPVLATRTPSLANGDLKLKPKFQVTFRIRPEAKWSDGQPVTSEDVKFTWQTQIDPKFKAASRSGWDTIASVATPDAKTAVVTFKKAFAPWADLYSPSGGGVLLPSHILKGQDLNTFWNNPTPAQMIGTGPYVLESYAKDERIVLRKNPNYWGATKPTIDRIISVYLKASQTADVQFKSGEINFLNTSNFAGLGDYRKFPKTTVDSKPGLTWEHLAFNLQDPLMKDINVRRAVAWAVDPGALIKVSTKGNTFPLKSFILPEQRPFYTPAWGKYSRNLAKVAAELKKSGYVKRGAFFEKDGKPLALKLVTISGNAVRESNFALLKKQLQSAGFKVSTSLDDNFFDETGPLITGNFQIGEFAFSTSADPSQTQLFGSAYIPTKKNPSGQNYYRVADKAFDALLAKADQETNLVKRTALIRQIQNIVAAKMALFPLYQRPESNLYANNLNGVVNNPTQVGVTDLTEQWSYTGGTAAR